MPIPHSFRDLRPDFAKRLAEIKNHRQGLALLLDGLEDPRNIGGIFRLADAAGLKEIIYRGDEKAWLPDKKSQRISRSTIKYVPFRGIDQSKEAIQSLANYEVLLLEWTETSIPIWDFQVDPSKEYLLVLGHEERGISPPLLNTNFKSIHIPMFGMNSSMNVTQAAAIATYELIRKLSEK